MRKSIVVFAIVASVLSASVAASACGDKLLQLSRIHHRHAVGEPVAVLVFSRPGSLLSNAANLRLEQTFQQEGYHVVLVNTEGELAAAVQARVSNTVIADIADLPAVRSLNSPFPLMVIPAVAKGAAGSVDSRLYRVVIKIPAKGGKFLDAVDAAVEARSPIRTSGLQTLSHSLR